ncbi:hypothetical protein CEXT_72492 [Caerostris extrusa]|uniref:Ribosomal protein S10 n=1 Tax=Caerostris extrusa TaxID=172846 RepID=A0AAV4XQC1_CAEEX|nr:hypothetical protein CEXT_72492 [Caerostris extrusa]
MKMTLKIFKQKEILNFIKITRFLKKALTSNFLSKLNSLSNIWNHKNCKVISIMLDIKEAVAVTEFIVKKFQKINIYHRLEFPLSTPPKKETQIGVFRFTAHRR